jgi:uncharacterized protein (AIM24 family)
VRDTVLGSTQPVLAISLEPDESVVGPVGAFAWMTDSIQMAAGQHGLSTYTAKEAAGTIAFAASRPGRILSVEVAPERDYLVNRRGFLAGTPGIEVGDESLARSPVLRRIGGRGRAWIELSGDAVRQELAAGASLRTHPWHIGMSDASVTVQMAELPEPAVDELGADSRWFAVLSGPGTVWLQSMALQPAGPPSEVTPTTRQER